MEIKSKGSVKNAAMLLAMLMFLTLALLLIAMGVSVYSGIVEGSDTTYQQRTGLSYITNKVRHGNLAGGVSVGELDGNRALLISQTLNGVDYTTYIYYHDGWLREIFCRTELSFSPSDGEKIIALSALDFTPLGDGLVKISARGSDNAVNTAVLAISVNGEAGQ